MLDWCVHHLMNRPILKKTHCIDINCFCTFEFFVKYWKNYINLNFRLIFWITKISSQIETKNKAAWLKSLLVILALDLNPPIIISFALNLNPASVVILGLHFLCLLNFSLLYLLPFLLHFVKLLLPTFFLDRWMTDCSSFYRVFLSFLYLLFWGLGEFTDPLRHWTARNFQQISQRSDDRFVLISKKRDSTSVSISPSSSSNSMNIGKYGIGEIIVDDQVCVLEINTSGYNIGRYQSPILSLVKFSNYFLPLIFWFLASEYLDFLFSADCGLKDFLHFVIKLFSSEFLLNKYQNRRNKTTFENKVLEIDDLAILVCTVLDRLFDFV